MPPRARGLTDRLGMILLGPLVIGLGSSLVAGVETWRQESPAAFAKGKKDKVVVSDTGTIRLAQEVAEAGSLDAARVWDLARGGDGTVYAATGDAGKVFRRKGEDGPWEVAYDDEDTQILSLVTLPDGHVFAGTGPSGRVVDLSDEKHPASRPDKDVLYIWDLAADAEGNLYAATGPTGQLWKRSAGGTWSRLLDSKHAHLLSVAVGPDGAVYAGSDGEGLIYRVEAGGKVSVVYDAPQAEVRTLLVGPDGALYAGTAAPSGNPSGGPGRTPSSFPGGGSSPGSGSSSDDAPKKPTAVADEPPTPPRPSASRKDSGSSPGPSGGTAAPRSPSPGENAIYRVGADGVPREVFRARTLIFALAWHGGRLIAGTGPEGQLYEVRDGGRETAPLARLDHGQVLALLAPPTRDGDLLIGAGDPGGVARLSPGFVNKGTFTSDVRDTKLLSRFGTLSWRADCPRGTKVALQARSGNVEEPDETWSDWSAPQDDPASARAAVPPARFIQYRATLATTDPSASPELRSVALLYRTANLPPEIKKIDVPDLSAGDGATRQSKLTLKWDVSDPNDDDLTYTLHLRKEGWPDWVELKSDLDEKTYAWDAASVPDGRYRVRVTASDRPSNPPSEAQERRLVSEPFLVDHRAPDVTVTVQDGGARVAVTLKDELTRLARAAYSLDGGDWTPIFPDDGLFDAPGEAITIELDASKRKPGTHVLTVRAADAAGNVGTGDAVFSAPSSP